MSNTEIWDALGKTDPKATKQFTRAGGFKGTAIKPQWAIKRITEHFGPVGSGWGHNKPEFQVVAGADGETLVYCTVECWHTTRENTFHGVGGDKVISKNSRGLFSDDEAFKKSFTDAVMNAFKSLGVGADIHMGQFDDNKYVSQMRHEFSDDQEKRVQGQTGGGSVEGGAERISKAQWSKIVALLESTNTNAAPILTHFKVDDLKKLTAAQAIKAINQLEDKLSTMAKEESNKTLAEELGDEIPGFE